MESSVAGAIKADDVLFLIEIVAVAMTSSLVVFVACFYWFRREQRRLQKRIVEAITRAGSDPDEFFFTGTDAAACGELVAQFKVDHGKRIVSLLESDGKRFIHVDGELSAPERARMVRYLKSEGFMS